MKYIVKVPGDRPVTLDDWRSVEKYLYLLQTTDKNAWLAARISEVPRG